MNNPRLHPIGLKIGATERLASNIPSGEQGLTTSGIKTATRTLERAQKMDNGEKTGAVPESPPRLDWAQGFLVAVCLFELIFFLVYMFSYNMQHENTISDSLFNRPEYAIVLTICLSLRGLGVTLFLLRYRYSESMWTTIGWVGLTVSLFGWCAPPTYARKVPGHVPNIPGYQEYPGTIHRSRKEIGIV